MKVSLHGRLRGASAPHVQAGSSTCPFGTLGALSRYPFVCPPSELEQLFGFPHIFSTLGTELPELIGLCGRILVFYQGRLVGDLDGSRLDDHRLLHLINTGERPPGTALSREPGQQA